MSNQILVSKITPQTMTDFTVDWIYGTDESSVTCSTIINLSSLPTAERQNVSAVAEVLQTTLDASVFSDLNANITALGAN